MDREGTRVNFVATCPHCEHDPLSVGEIRIAGAGADIALTCRACGGAAVLTVEETPHHSGDGLANSMTATAHAGAETGEPEQSAMLSKLNEALEHSRNVGTCLEAFVGPGAHAQVVPARALQILAIASSLVDNLDEALATSRDAISSRW